MTGLLVCIMQQHTYVTQNPKTKTVTIEYINVRKKSYSYIYTGILGKGGGNGGCGGEGGTS